LRKPDLVLKYFNVVKELKIDPDTYTYNYAIQAYADLKDKEKMIYILAELLASDSIQQQSQWLLLTNTTCLMKSPSLTLCVALIY
jgi:hypothetical protein